MTTKGTQDAISLEVTKKLTSNKAYFIPLRHNKKLPATKFKDKLASGGFSAKELKDFTKKGAGLALACQPNYVFFDIDTPENHSDDGIGNFKKWLTDNGMDADKIINGTLQSRTPSGGMHLVFLQNGSEHFTQDIAFLPGVDIKASDNNYIVVYPTVIDGKQYRWVNTLDPIPMPAKLMEAAKKQAKEKTKKILDSGGFDEQGVRYYVRDPEDKNCKPVIDVFDVIKRGFGDEGGRNNHIFEWAGRMRYITDMETALEFAKIANDNTPDPEDFDSIFNTIRSAYEWSPDFASELAEKTLRNVGTINGEEILAFQGKWEQSELAILKRDYEITQSTDPNDYQGRLLTTSIVPVLSNDLSEALHGTQLSDLHRTMIPDEMSEVVNRVNKL